MTSNSPSSAGYFLDNPVNGAVNGPPTSLLPSAKPQKKPKPPPLSLVPEAHFWPLLSPLAEFAAIATSPESPLVRETSLGGDIFDVTSRGYQRSYSTPPPPLVSDQNSRISESACSTSYSPSMFDVISPLSTVESDLSSSGNLTNSWSSSITECLKQRTSSQFYDEPFRGTETSNYMSTINSTTCPTSGLKRKERTTSEEKQASIFKPYDLNDRESQLEPFVKNTSWTPFYPDRALNHHGVPCQELLIQDICIPLSRRDETIMSSPEAEVSPKPDAATSVLFDLDSAALALSSMAKRKEEHDLYNQKVKSKLHNVKRRGETRMRKSRNEGLNGKRPMNAFMLFAKRYRVEITQKHPGKDNRAISVILGDRWKSLSYEDRKTYIKEAKLLADEHKRTYPDCWKRKRVPQAPKTTARKS